MALAYSYRRVSRQEFLDALESPIRDMGLC